MRTAKNLLRAFLISCLFLVVAHRYANAEAANTYTNETDTGQIITPGSDHPTSQMGNSVNFGVGGSPLGDYQEGSGESSGSNGTAAGSGSSGSSRTGAGSSDGGGSSGGSEDDSSNEMR
jgi:hypothetical protein